MKNITKFLAFLAIGAIFASCSATYNAAAYEDDVYYNPYRVERLQKKQKKNQDNQDEVNADANSYSGNATTSEQSDYSNARTGQNDESTVYLDENGDEYYVDNNVADDYYDYSYSSRIKRFHSQSPCTSYYDDYYTDPYYYGGGRYGSSIY